MSIVTTTSMFQTRGYVCYRMIWYGLAASKIMSSTDNNIYLCFFQGRVVIIRGEGPKGGPGMPEMLTPTSAIMGAGLGKVLTPHRMHSTSESLL